MPVTNCSDPPCQVLEGGSYTLHGLVFSSDYSSTTTLSLEFHEQQRPEKQALLVVQ